MWNWLLRRRPRSAAWRQHPNAPAANTFVCALSDLEDEVPAYLNVGGDTAPAFFCFIIRRGGRLRAFLANCPHRDRPLATPGARALYGRGEIACSHHGALFSVDSGRCIRGPCRGDSLMPVDVYIDGDAVRIAGR